MKKRIFATLCALCCIFAIFFVFSGCNDTPSSGGVTSNTPPNSSDSNGATTDENGESNNKENPNEPDDVDDASLGGGVVYDYFAGSYAELEKFLQGIANNNTVNMVLFNLDNGLSCVDENDFILGPVIYQYWNVVDIFKCKRLDTYALLRSGWDVVSGEFETQALKSKNIPSHRGFNVQFEFRPIKASFKKEDILFVQLTDVWEFCCSGFGVENMRIDGYAWDMFVGDEWLGAFNIRCQYEMADEIFEALTDCMVICSNLNSADNSLVVTSAKGVKKQEPTQIPPEYFEPYTWSEGGKFFRQTGRFANFEKLLQSVGKNNLVNTVLFNLDNGLSCMNNKDYWLGSTIYKFESEINCDEPHADSDMFDGKWQIRGSFGTNSFLFLRGNPLDDLGLYNFSAQYVLYNVDSPFTKDDVSFVEITEQYDGDVFERWHGRVFEIRANGELLGLITFSDRSDSYLNQILASLRDCMVVVSNL